jgi:uncharacterized membrane protein
MAVRCHRPLVPWWAWVLLGWAVVATVVSFWLASAAGLARRREREARAHQYETLAKRLRDAG